MTANQTVADRAFHFAELHREGNCFVIPNPWDPGSARMLAALGFPALATTSAGYAFSRGLLDGQLDREQALAHCAEIVNATELPVSADLEKGFGDDPESAAATVRGAAQIGLAGCSIEDYTGRDDDPIYGFDQAVERVAAAAEAVRALDRPFVFTARAENHLHGRRDLDDTIARLVAFAAAGADVLYAPGLRDLDDIRTLCASVSRPVNVIMGMSGVDLRAADLAAAGVTRISVGSSLMRLAYGEMVRVAANMLGEGRFDYGDRAAPFARFNELLGAPPAT